MATRLLREQRQTQSKEHGKTKLVEADMKTMTRLISSASFSRSISIAILALLFCVSVMASDGQRSTSTGDAEQPSPDATGHFTRPDSKHATSSSAIQSVDANRVFGDDTAMPKGKNSPAAKDAPLTVKGKFNYFFTRSFLRPTPYATAIAAGAFGEWLDDDHHHHAKPGDFAADSMTRAARSFAFGTSANFFEKFAYASLFKQDPRYHKSEKTGAGARITYAVSRLFITQSDQGAKQFNASFIAGGLTAAGLSNVWERDERRTAAETIKRWGLHVGFSAAANILHEFIGKR
jgi:hypothetical protein